MHTASREPLRKPREGQNVSGNACGTPANTKKFFETLAGLPQTPKSSSRHLRDSRKRQKVLRDTCGTPANAKKFLVTLAGLPQTPKSSSRHLRGSRHSPRRLRRPRKYPGICRDVCGAPANTKKFFAALAAFLQRPSPGERRLMLSSNSRIEEAEAVCDGGYLWRRFQTMTDEKMDYGCDDRVCDGGKRTGI